VARSALALFVLSMLLATPLNAQEMSVDQMVRSLTPQPLTRSFRGVSVEEDDVPPSIDIRVEFAFDSAELTGDATITLGRLGEALRDQRLADYRFRIAGHTDARGSDDYNLALSERRAASVRNFLTTFAGLSGARLESIGHGESQLFDPSNPEGQVNRRKRLAVHLWIWA